MEAMLMMRPYFCAIMNFSARRVPQNAEVQFHTMPLSQASSLSESIIAQPSEPPAQLTRMSTRPKVSAV